MFFSHSVCMVIRFRDVECVCLGFVCPVVPCTTPSDRSSNAKSNPLLGPRPALLRVGASLCRLLATGSTPRTLWGLHVILVYKVSYSFSYSFHILTCNLLYSLAHSREYSKLSSTVHTHYLHHPPDPCPPGPDV